jgi:hypothetical protein
MLRGGWLLGFSSAIRDFDRSNFPKRGALLTQRELSGTGPLRP